MSTKFDCLSIDNNAIHLVIDQLAPFLKYESDSEYRVLDIDNEIISKKHLTLYEDIFVPYIVECKKHHLLHHYAGAFYPDSWFGEQTCLSMIHYLNQKAWWLLHFYAVKEAVKRHCNINDEMLNRISHQTTHCILDGDMSISSAINRMISSELSLERFKEDMISNDIAQTIEKYKDMPSIPMVYR